ncbi:MAG: L-aspartate oxidase [Fimbriimonadaceae bacterium]|nr:L-aspartate oxidase [Fimbriimonadaceae bacterium]QYK55764.1 MAG: L-aspartate oxidase [Fimbriimonadaceae bacterium]
MAFEQHDFLVVGSGLAGLTFALRASEHGRVCVLTKAALTESNTNYAQGGIAAAIGESDDWQLHEEDTLVAGAGLCDVEAVRFLVRQAPAEIEWLRSLGARFDLSLGREGGHSRNRIVHHADRTGWEVERAVSGAVRENPNITFFENAYATNLLTANGRVVGVRAEVADLGARHFLGRAVMLATGGCGRLYAQTTNPRVATADGIGLADGVGAEIRDMEFMQFHPTTLHHAQAGGFLISEAVRGAGGTLRNHRGRRFMYDYDKRLELAPRDVVARAIEREMQRLATWCVYLDTTHLDADLLEQEFPTIWSTLRNLGMEMEKDWIPIVPAQHYSCGGVVTNLKGQTTLPGLFAAGEVARTGVHGANRLASNSLLEAMVFSSAAAAAAKDEPAPGTPATLPPPPKSVLENDAVRIRHSLMNAMSQGVGVFRTTAGLRSAQERVAELRDEYESANEAPFSTYSLETLNLLVAARYVVDGAIQRRENVGLHYNADFDQTVRARPERPATAAPKARA